MKICRLCKASFPEYTISGDLMSAISGNIDSECCPACVDTAARKNGLILSWTASFGAAASLHEPEPSMISVPKTQLTYHSEWSKCQLCGTETVLNGRCTNPQHDSLELS